jgi:glycosyltransferase involved in cell wall biosynthesis
MKALATIILSFYNKPDILKLVLAGFERQSEKAFEIVIADDGSNTDAVKALERIIQSSPLQIQHVWHKDEGWRKNIILNKAIVAAKSPYLIFVDGDCIPHRHFVKEHLNAREEGFILTGRRVLLSKNISEFLSFNKVRNGWLEKLLFPWMLIERVAGKGQFVENALYFKYDWIRKRINNKRKGLLGSNFSLHKSDMLVVNGFDERYLAPYVGEDTDLEYRLRKHGFKFRHLKHLAIQYHLFHPRLEFNNENHALLQENMQRSSGYTPFGIVKS